MKYKIEGAAVICVSTSFSLKASYMVRKTHAWLITIGGTAEYGEPQPRLNIESTHLQSFSM